MNDFIWIVILYPGLPILAVTISPFLNGDSKLGHTGIQCLLLFLAMLTGPVLGGMWSLTGGIFHFAGNCPASPQWQHSILWHVIPFFAALVVVGIIIPHLESYNGRKF